MAITNVPPAVVIDCEDLAALLPIEIYFVQTNNITLEPHFHNNGVSTYNPDVTMVISNIFKFYGATLAEPKPE